MVHHFQGIGDGLEQGMLGGRWVEKKDDMRDQMGDITKKSGGQYTHHKGREIAGLRVFLQSFPTISKDRGRTRGILPTKYFWLYHEA